MSFDDYGTGRLQLFRVRGTASGLEGERASLLLNGTSLEVADGLFAFPATLADGSDFEVTVSSPKSHECAITGGKGKITHADSTDAVVTCVSRDATLKALSISIGELSPAFDPAKLAYTVDVRRKSIVTTTLTVSATPASPGAHVSIGDVALPSAKPSAPLPVKEGTSVVDIAVVAANGSALHYTVVVNATNGLDYLKASDTTQEASFGMAVAASGTTLAVASTRGVYVFTRSGSAWSQQALFQELLGQVSIALDGDTLATASDGRTSPSAGVIVLTRSGSAWSPQPFDLGPPSGPNTIALSGDTLAVGTYVEEAASFWVRVFRRTGGIWAQEGAPFVHATTGAAAPQLALSGDTLVIGDASESSAATGIDGNQSDTSAPGAGAVYVLNRSGTTWALHAYLKASNARAGAEFGYALAVSADTLVVGADQEASNAVGVNGDQTNTKTGGAGAAYVFTRAAGVWSQAAYLKGASQVARRFGASVAVLADTVAVGAPSGGVGSSAASAAYIFRRAEGVWTASPRVMPPIIGDTQFGSSVALGADFLAVGAPYETSKATGVNGDQNDKSAPGAGAVFVY